LWKRSRPRSTRSPTNAQLVHHPDGLRGCLLSQRAALRILPRRSRMPCTSSHRAGSVDGKTRTPLLPSKQGL
jgi:hypothetical protein